MRVPNAEHARHRWLISQIAPDFNLLDVWALPAQGGAHDFAALVDIITSLEPTNSGWSTATRSLFWLRHRIGGWFAWDDAAAALSIPGCTETTLRARIPEGLRDTTTRPKVVSGATFVPIYRTDTEWAAEISNTTVHGVLHLAWVHQGDHVYRGHLGIYVKPRGRLGNAYLAVIGPFRHLVVYPELMRQVELAWKARGSAGIFAGDGQRGRARPPGASRRSR